MKRSYLRIQCEVPHAALSEADDHASVRAVVIVDEGFSLQMFCAGEILFI